METENIPKKQGKTYIGLTAIEEQTIEALIEVVKSGSDTPITDAADKLRVPSHQVSMVLYRVRNRYDKASDFIKIYHKFKERLGPKTGRKYL